MRSRPSWSGSVWPRTASTRTVTGEAFPIAPNSTADGRIANRRAEIRVLQGN